MREHGAHPLAATMLPVLYWSDTVDGWWPQIAGRRLSRFHYGCGGWLYAIPPGTQTRLGSGSVCCLKCSETVAEIRSGRGNPLTPAQLQALRDESGRRGPKRRPKAARKGYRPCADCGTLTMRADAVRCKTCNNAHRTAQSRAARLTTSSGVMP